MADRWNSHRIKNEGRQCLAMAARACDEQTIRTLVTTFAAVRAGQKVLRDQGVSLEAMATLDDVDTMAQTVHHLCQMQAPVSEGVDGHDGVVDSEAFGTDEESDEALTQKQNIKQGHSVKEGSAGGHYKPARPAHGELQEWSHALVKHNKFNGVCQQRYRGCEFKMALLKHMVHAGKNTKPADVRLERHHPTVLNQSASKDCNEADTQATCECHSAGPKSVEARVQTFLIESQAAGLSRVNIVTGLGSHGGGGTIRQLMPALLQASTDVRSFQLASNYAAMYVELVR